MIQPLAGLDVSNNNGPIDWSAVAGAGYHFTIAKASEGLGFQDGTFVRNATEARRAGLLTGAYHFAQNNNAVAEARNFVAAVKALGPLPIGFLLVLDLEVPVADPVGYALAWAGIVRAAFPQPLGLYTDLGYLNLHLGDPRLAQSFWLWLADWGVAQLPPGAGPWGEIALWQTSNRGRVPGIGGDVDLDQLYRDRDHLCLLGTPGPVYLVSTAQHLRPSPSYLPFAGPLLPVGAVVTALGATRGSWRRVATTQGQVGWMLDRNITPRRQGAAHA